MSPSTVALLALLPLIAWRMYGRVRRMVSRQPLSRVRPWLTIVLFPLLIAFIGTTAVAQMEGLVCLAAALASGVALGVFGLNRTQFQATEEGLFYTPSAHVGIALSTLFVGRMLYRLAQTFTSGSQVSNAQFASSPLTLSVFGLLAGYYVAYAIGLLRWRGSVEAAKRGRGSGSP